MAQALITQTKDMLDSFHNNALLTRPEGRRLTQLEHEMANILARTDISDRQKMEQFSHTLQNFQKVRGVIIDNGLMLTSTNSTVIPAEEQENRSEGVFSRIQNIIQEALKTEKEEEKEVEASKTPIKVKKIAKAPKTLKVKKLAAINLKMSKRKTRAAAASLQPVNVRPNDTPVSKRLKSSGNEYTPIYTTVRKKLIKGNGHVNFDGW